MPHADYAQYIPRIPRARFPSSSPFPLLFAPSRPFRTHSKLDVASKLPMLLLSVVVVVAAAAQRYSSKKFRKFWRGPLIIRPTTSSRPARNSITMRIIYDGMSRLLDNDRRERERAAGLIGYLRDTVYIISPRAILRQNCSSCFLVIVFFSYFCFFFFFFYSLCSCPLFLSCFRRRKFFGATSSPTSSRESAIRAVD